jgi:hypothetical protein
MTATHTALNAAPQPLVATPARIAAAVAVAAVLALTWLYAEQASHQAVDTTAAAIARSGTQVTRVTLPTVEIMGRRHAASTPVAVARGARAAL